MLCFLNLGHTEDCSVDSEPTSELPIAIVTLYRVEPDAPSGVETPPAAGTPEDEDTRKFHRNGEGGRAGDPLHEVEIGSAVLYASRSVTIGRTDACDLQARMGGETQDSTISRIHCIVSSKLGDDGQNVIKVTDTSMNATFLNDSIKLHKGDSIIFDEGAFVALGGNVFDLDLNANPRTFRVRYTPVKDETEAS